MQMKRFRGPEFDLLASKTGTTTRNFKIHATPEIIPYCESNFGQFSPRPVAANFNEIAQSLEINERAVAS